MLQASILERQEQKKEAIDLWWKAGQCWVELSEEESSGRKLRALYYQRYSFLHYADLANRWDQLKTDKYTSECVVEYSSNYHWWSTWSLLPYFNDAFGKLDASYPQVKEFAWWHPKTYNVGIRIPEACEVDSLAAFEERLREYVMMDIHNHLRPALEFVKKMRLVFESGKWMPLPENACWICWENFVWITISCSGRMILYGEL